MLLLLDDKLMICQVARIQNNLVLALHKKWLLQILMLLELFANEEKGINNATTIAADLLKTNQLLIYSLVKSR
jgi:trigger factor